jgi:phage shock protein E
MERGLAKSHQELPDKNARIVLHCASGGRGTLAAQSLQGMGYTNVAKVDEGINA